MAEKTPRYLSQSWYIISFILGLSLFSGVLLSSIYYVLSPYQKRSAEFDRNSQMLIAAHILDCSGTFCLYNGKDWLPANYNKQTNLLEETLQPTTVTSPILDLYSKAFVRPLLADRSGNLFSFEEKHMSLSTLLEKSQCSHLYLQPLLLVYAILKNTATAAAMSNQEITKNLSAIQAVVIPISGFGLWGPVYGFLGIQNDGNTVLGTTWYQQGETPGLGANIANPQWQKQFYGKKVFSSTDYASATLGIDVIKGSVATVLGDSPLAKTSVDGISGATLTCRGITEAYAQSLAPYRQLLIRFAAQQGV